MPLYSYSVIHRNLDLFYFICTKTVQFHCINLLQISSDWLHALHLKCSLKYTHMNGTSQETEMCLNGLLLK